jgi:putative ABC transport system substrate-binding protein
VALAAAPWAQAQQPRRVYRIGYPAISPLHNLTHLMAAFEQGLRDLGYQPGKDVLIDLRSAEGNLERYRQIVQDIVRTKPDVILTGVNANTSAARAATQTIPIVMMLGSDVIRAGYAKTLAKPGGNITGLSSDVGAEVITKRLELLREAVPKISRLAILSEPPHRVEYRAALDRATASVLRMDTLWLEFSGDLERDFAEIVRWRADALFHLPQARMFGQRAQIAGLEAKHRLPSAHTAAEFAEAGGLMAYGANLSVLFRSAASYVDRIFKGAKPAELPIEQPSRIDLVINLQTARALGLTLPSSILLRADRVIA